MRCQMLRKPVIALLEKESFLTHIDVAKKLKKDKVRISGYLEAMVDFGELSVKKVGNSKVYFLNKNRKVNG